ncbi:hypothetical protein ACIBO2_44715 [Nonomuraea sp. NPDC050022]|uniref:hypothetical protein n=1 Tax=unclassified Nonomuraea TaxID=2593643 RepID=UPI0033E3C004
MTISPDSLSPDGWDSPARPKPPLRPTWWQRFVARARAWFTSGGLNLDPFAPPTSITPDYVPRDTFSLSVPALGDAFDFTVTVLVAWEVRGTAAGEPLRHADPAELQRFIASSRQGAREVIEELIRPVARRFPPYQAAEAERELAKVLQACFHDGDLQAKVRVRVDVAAPVKDELRKVWIVRLHEDGKGDLRKQAVRLTSDLQDIWHDVLRKGLTEFGEVDIARTSWIAPYALALTEDPKNAASYLQLMLEKRVDQAEKLLASLSNITLSGDHVDALEIAFQSDSALRAVLKELGVAAGDPRIATSSKAGDNA